MSNWTKVYSNRPKLTVNAAECFKCEDIIYSRTVHDLRYCSCGEIAVDGGLERFYIISKSLSPKTMKLEIKATAHELYNDWNTMTNEFGLVSKVGKQYSRKPENRYHKAGKK